MVWVGVGQWVGYDGEENMFKLMEATARKEAVWVAFLDSMNKSKEHGFLGFWNTVKSFASRHMDRQAKGVQDCSLMPFIYLFLVVLRPDAVLYITSSD